METSKADKLRKAAEKVDDAKLKKQLIKKADQLDNQKDIKK